MRFWLLSVLLTLSLFSDPKDPYQIAITEGEPAALVEGMVSAITGDLYVNENDAIIQGQVPIRLPRYYISGNGKGKYAGWYFIDHLLATYSADPNTHTINIVDSNGTHLSFTESAAEVKKKFEKKKNTSSIKYNPPDFSNMPGLTNTSDGDVSAQTNLKNAQIKLDPDGREFTVYCPDGTERRYKAHHKQDHFKEVFKGEKFKTLEYYLQSEKLSSGNYVIYGYNSDDRLCNIRTASPNQNKTYASAGFNYMHKHASTDPSFEINTSDGRRLHYWYVKLHKHGHNFVLKRVTFPDAPPEEIDYHGEESHAGPLVGRRASPDNRYFDIDYYRPKHNNVGGTDIKLGSDDPRILRVKTLSAPVGTDSTPIVTHKFFYTPQNRTTDVRDIDNILTRYQYSEQMRLEWITRFGTGDQPYNSEQFTWSKSGELLSRTFFDSSKRTLLSRHFTYDAKGNVLEEKLSGQGGSYSLKRDYSQDDRNLVLREEESNGKITLYTYLPNAALLTSKLICDHNQIRQRFFYEYNSDLIVTREIIDDGTTSDKNNLTNVKTRRIKDIIPMPGGPYINMPYIIEEKYWDGHQEVLLKKTELSYTNGGQVSAEHIFDAKGELQYSLTTTYDHLGRPTEKTNALGQTAKYAYDACGNIVFTQDFGGRLSTYMSYDHSNRLTESKQVGFDGIERITKHFYDRKHNRTLTIDPFGNETHFAYDPFGHVIETRHPDGTSRYASYDNAGRATSLTDGKKATTSFDYNWRSQKTAIHYPDGTEESFTYNPDGTLKTHINQERNRVQFTYDALGRKLSHTDPLGNTTQLTYDGFNLTSTTDAEGHVTTYTYDGAGRKICETQNEESLHYTYDSLNRLHSIQSGDLLMIMEYDLLGRVIEERKEDSQKNLLSKIQYEYDEAGNRTAITRNIMGEEARETFAYDSFNRLTSHIDALGYETQTLYVEDQVLTKTTIDPLGLHTIETYDSMGRLASTQIQKDDILSLEQKTYDENGNCTSQESTVYPTGRTVITEWSYDILNRLTSLTEAAGTPESKTTLTSYTPNGLPSQTTKPDGVILERRYDAAGNLKSLTSSDKTIHYTYLYNNLHQLIQSKDQLTGATTERTLDHKGRILEEKLATNLRLKNQYDLQGRRTELTLPDLTTIQYDYDALYLRKISRLNYTHEYTDYDLSGHLISEKLANSLGSTNFHIDPLGRNDAIQAPFFTQHVTQFDPAGNIRELVTQNITSTYSYDDLYHLTQEKGLFNHDYAYDSHHNRLQKNQNTFQVNALNQLPHITYDPNGNPISSGDTTYTYDALDRLITIQTPTLKLSFTYDHLHRRLTKTTQTEQLFFIYDGQNEIGATTSTSQITELRILGSTPKAEISSAIALELSGQIYIPTHDLMGNIAHLTTLNGHTQQTYHYDAFGNTPTIPLSPWTYSSKRLDPETGLIFFGRRYYDPIHGRWLTPDPLGLSAGINLYAFVLNNPLTHLDLYGLSVLDKSSLYIDPPPIQHEPIPSWFVGTKPTPRTTRQIGESAKNTPQPNQFSLGLLRSSINTQRPSPKVRHLKNRPQHPNVHFTFMTGIMNSARDTRKSARYVSDLYGGWDVTCVTNPSFGFFGDLNRAHGERFNNEITPAALLLQQVWEQSFKDYPSKIILHTCHSEAVIVGKSSLNLMTPEQRSKIFITAIAPAAYIPRDLCGGAVHYCSEKDIIPQMLAIPTARKLGENNFAILPSLDPHSDFDHGLVSPTYRKPIQDSYTSIIETGKLNQ